MLGGTHEIENEEPVREIGLKLQQVDSPNGKRNNGSFGTMDSFKKQYKS